MTNKAIQTLIDQNRDDRCANALEIAVKWLSHIKETDDEGIISQSTMAQEALKQIAEIAEGK